MRRRLFLSVTTHLLSLTVQLRLTEGTSGIMRRVPVKASIPRPIGARARSTPQLAPHHGRGTARIGRWRESLLGAVRWSRRLTPALSACGE